MNDKMPLEVHFNGKLIVRVDREWKVTFSDGFGPEDANRILDEFAETYESAVKRTDDAKRRGQPCEHGAADWETCPQCRGEQ